MKVNPTYGTIPKIIVMMLQEMETQERIKIIQQTALVKSVRLPGRVLGRFDIIFYSVKTIGYYGSENK